MTYRIFASLPEGLRIIESMNSSKTSQEGHLAIPQLIEIDRLKIITPENQWPTWLSWIRGKGLPEIAFRFEDVFFEIVDDYTGELIAMKIQFFPCPD